MELSKSQLAEISILVQQKRNLTIFGVEYAPVGPFDRMFYEGSFDLTFLRDGETVGSAGDGTGACYVEQKTATTAHGLRLDVGQTLARLPDGTFYAYDAAEAS